MFRIKLAVITAVVAAALVPAAMARDENRTSTNEKGSLLVYPKVELRFSTDGCLKQDTIITINNDYQAAVNVQMYFVSEMCTHVDNLISLTRNEPAYWSVNSGLPKGVSPFTVLGAPCPDPEGSGDLILRGYILAWAVNADDIQIKWNHLYGRAMFVNYQYGTAAEYNAYAFQALDNNIANGDIVAEDPANPAQWGVLKLDGTANYDSAFEYLMFDFFASGAAPFCGSTGPIVNDTDLTLLILSNDLSDTSTGPLTTRVKFDIWNQNEVAFSGMKFCMTKWDETLLSCRGGHFLRQNLQTDLGRARLIGQHDAACDLAGPHPVVSCDAALLGVVARVLHFSSWDATSCTTLVGAGQKAAEIKYSPLPASGTKSKKLTPAVDVRGTAVRVNAVAAD
jgi:hypothetical protein